MSASIYTFGTNLFSKAKEYIFGAETKKSAHTDSSWETKEGSPTNLKQSSDRDSKDNKGFNNPGKFLTTNTDMELIVSKKPISEKILSELKAREQSNNFEIYKANPLINDLLTDMKQKLRNKEGSNLVKGQIKEPSLQIAEILIQETFQKISQIDNNANFEEVKNQFELYLHEYCESCLALINEIQKIILNETLENSSILQADFLETIQSLKEVSSEVSSKFLNKITAMIPGQKAGSSDSKTFKQLTTEKAWPNIRKLIIGSHFGILDSNLVKPIFNSGLDLNKINETDLYSNLAFITKLQKIVQGTVLINNGKNESNEINIGSIPQDLAQKVLDLYTTTIIKSVELKYDHISDKLQTAEISKFNHRKSDLRQFFNKWGRNESNSFKGINDLEKFPIWENLGIDMKGELEKIKSNWVPAGTVSKLLGSTQAETLPGGYKVEATYLLNFLFNDDDAKRNFERIVLELSALAGIDAISTYKGWKKDDHSLLENYESYQKDSIPWIKDFYAKRYAAMKDLISKEKSEIHITSVVEYISHLALELTNSTKLFSPDDYLNRYAAKPYIEELFKFMFNSTRTGILPLNILLAQSWGPKESSVLSQREMKEIEEVIEFIKIESLLKDENGDIQYAPIGHSKAIDETFTRLSESLSNTGFLLNRADVIMKFLKKSIEAALNANRNEAEFDILKSHNIILATWLFYILVKFLPEKTNDIQALKIKANIVGSMLDEKLRLENIIPKTLYSKLRSQALGLKDDNLSLDPKHTGTFRSLFEELDSRINDIATGRESKDSLKDLIYIYAELEKNINQNQRTLGVISKIFKDRKDVHMLEGLDKAITKVMYLDTDLDLIINSDEFSTKKVKTTLDLIVDYAKHCNNPKVKTAVANSLLDKVTNLAESLLKQNINRHGEFEIKDNNEEDIFNMIKTLHYLNQIGFLFNTHSNKFLNLRPSQFLDQDNNINREQQVRELQAKIDLVHKFLQQKVNLLIADDPQKESFPNQLNAKNILIDLLKKFPRPLLSPAVGLSFEWRNLKNVSTLRERSLQLSKENLGSLRNARL